MNNYNSELNKRFLLQEEYLGNNKVVNKVEPLVSVTVITYQQADYIADCINGILMQRTTFPIEIIIGEDGSSDGTTEICKDFAEKNRDKIRLFIRDSIKRARERSCVLMVYGIECLHEVSILQYVKVMIIG